MLFNCVLEGGGSKARRQRAGRGEQAEQSESATMRTRPRPPPTRSCGGRPSRPEPRSSLGGDKLPGAPQDRPPADAHLHTRVGTSSASWKLDGKSVKSVTLVIPVILVIAPGPSSLPPAAPQGPPDLLRPLSPGRQRDRNVAWGCILEQTAGLSSKKNRMTKNIGSALSRSLPTGPAPAPLASPQLPRLPNSKS